jgi:hypothetical protein
MASTPTAPTLVAFASYVGHLPERESPEIAELRADLEALGVVARPQTVMSAIGDRLPWPGIMDRGAKPTGLTRAELLDPVEIGYQAWASAKFAEAVPILVRAIARIRRNPALLVTDTNNLAVIYKAYLTLALCEAKLDRPAESEAVMEELIRMFPTQPVVRGESGPEAWELYRSVFRHVRERGHGRLVVNTGNEQAIIFIDDQLRGTSRVDLQDLVPGIHYVFVQIVGTLGRQHRVQVAANKINTLASPWDLDQSTWLTETDAAIVFPTETDHAKEGVYASGLLEHWGGQQIVIITPLKASGKPSIRGTIYDAQGEAIRSASVELDHDTSTRLQALARFLAHGEPSDGIHVLVSPAPAGARRDTPQRWPRWAGPVGVGVGLALGGTGIAVFKSAPNDNGHVSLLHDRREIGLGVSLLGSAAVGGGVYLWCRDRLDMPTLPAALLAGGSVALSYGIALYVVNEDPSPHLGPKIIHSAPEGIAVGATGLAAVGAGLWLALRGDGSHPPVIAPQHGGGIVSWGGSF